MSNWESDVIAVTGTIGSGKSTFVEHLKKNGAFTVSADELAREVVKPGTKGFDQVIATFGNDFISSRGDLDRTKLGKLVFSDPQKKRKLEEILHPLIADLAQKSFQSSDAQGKLKIYDCPLLFEAGLNKKGFKKIVLVSAPPEACLSRIMTRDKLSQEEAERRLKAQWPIKDKINKADTVIDNSLGLDQLKTQAERFYRQSKSEPQ